MASHVFVSVIPTYQPASRQSALTVANFNRIIQDVYVGEEFREERKLEKANTDRLMIYELLNSIVEMENFFF